MADMIDKEFAALMDSRGEDTTTEQEEAAANVEQQQQKFEESAAPANQQQPQQDKPADQAQGAADANKPAEQQAQPKPADASEEAKKHIDNMKAQAHEERQRRRAAEAAVEAANQRAAQIEAQFRQVIAELQQKANKAPDPEEDVVGALKATQQQLQQFQQMEAQRRQQAAQIVQQNQYVQKVTSAVEDYESEFKAEHPDYDEALDYVLDLKEHEFSVVGYSPEQAKQAAANWAMNAANVMLRQGKNPAQAGYEMAQKLGFKPKAAVAANGAAQPDAAAQAQAKAAQEAAAKLQQIKDGQAAGSKMSGGGNGSGFDGSLKSIAQLEGAAFDAASEKFLRQMTRG